MGFALGLERGSGHFYIEQRAISVARERPDDGLDRGLLKFTEVFGLTKLKSSPLASAPPGLVGDVNTSARGVWGGWTINF